jgi:hypothetical protein
MMSIDTDRWENVTSDYAIPARYRTKCEICQGLVDIRRDDGTICQFTSGWVMQRSGGGGHSIMRPKRENRWAHRRCVDDQGEGGVQRRLF